MAGAMGAHCRALPVGGWCWGGRDYSPLEPPWRPEVAARGQRLSSQQPAPRDSALRCGVNLAGEPLDVLNVESDVPFLLKMFGLCCRSQSARFCKSCPSLGLAGLICEMGEPDSQGWEKPHGWGRLLVPNVTCWTLGLQEKGRAAQEPVTLLPVPVPIFPKVCPWDGSASHPPPAAFLTSHVKSCHGPALGQPVLTAICEPVLVRRVLRFGGFYSWDRFSCLFVSKKHFPDSESLRI